MENNRIKTLREKNNLTLKEVAKGAGIDFTTLSKYENGVVKTGKVQTWKKLADYFGVSMAYLQNVDDFFDQRVHTDQFDRYEEYLKNRGVNFDLNKYDDSTISAFTQYELNQLDSALIWVILIYALYQTMKLTKSLICFNGFMSLYMA